MTSVFAIFAQVFLSMMPSPQADEWPPSSWTEQVEPFHIVGPVYYVGSRELTAYLLVDEEGLILINVGMDSFAGTLLQNIRSLGFDPGKLQHVLITQAHFDHAGGVAKVCQSTGAQAWTGSGDLAMLQSGGQGDYVFGDKYPFPSFPEGQSIKNGTLVSLGKLQLKTFATPGHTPGSTSWLLQWPDPKKGTQNILFQASVSVLDEKSLFQNPKYPQVVADYQGTFKTLGNLEVDVVLPDHMVFAHPKGQSHQDPIQIDWFWQQDILSRQLERSQKKLTTFIANQKQP